MDQIILKLKRKLCHTNDSILCVENNRTPNISVFNYSVARIIFLVIMYRYYVNGVM